MICKRCAAAELEPRGDAFQTAEGLHQEYRCPECRADGCQTVTTWGGPVVCERGTAFQGTRTGVAP